MSYRIAQNNEQTGPRQWKWWVWIENTGGDLTAIDQVTWTLHHTFSKPVVVKTNREDGFRLQRTGWGVFQIRANLHLANGENQPLRTWLKFQSTTGEPAEKRGAPTRKLFLSYGAEDESIARQVKLVLGSQGFQVLEADESTSEVPASIVADRLIAESDVVVSLVSSDFPSPYLIEEMDQARQSDKPMVTIVGEGVEGPQWRNRTWSFSQNTVHMDLRAENLGQNIAEMLHKFHPE